VDGLVHIAELIDLPLAPSGARPPGPPPDAGMEWVPGGTFRMGSNDFYPEEAPVHSATVRGFWMDRHPVTNADFAAFVKATACVTVAERELDPAEYPGAVPELLVPGSVVFRPPPHRLASLRDHFAWWAYVPGASWRHPTGPESSLAGLDAHPVVHVAWEDVAAYARWAGKSLPTEAEWEFAARGGLDGRAYAWGDELEPGGRVMANTWRGEFPALNQAGPEWKRTSAVGGYPPNGYGLYDLIGNVWEWTTSWWGSHARPRGSCCAAAAGADREASRDPAQPLIRIPRKVLKGGSYLCAPNYCARYRPAARIPQQVDTGTGHQGFRCILRVEPGGRGGDRAPH
jgi:sulfatase modifying factor 1